ncbi:MAG: peptide-methionine (R)-S-oxide reductase MsrB [Clostridiales bacterium]|nr:peptide-methionine (R)-S-oxide reductase MsrB [Clostridiales bacterium]
MISAILRMLMAIMLVFGLLMPGQQTTEGNQIAMKEQSKQYTKPSDEELRKTLSPLQYHVTQEAGTEHPYTNEYWQHSAPGIYVDIVTGEPLFTSKQKYQSSCGWPAFFDSIEDARIREIEDLSYGMKRTEVRSTLGDTHLGHVFENDPESPNGIRYCINSASLRFIPKDQMEQEGYGDLLKDLD